MKRIVCLLLTMVMLSCMAVAETSSNKNSVSDTVTETLNQDYYVSLRLVFDQIDGQKKELTLQVKAFTIQYTFELLKDKTDGSYTGFRYDPETVVALINNPSQELNPFLPLMNLTASVKEVPRNYSFNGKTGGFFMQINGGTMELNYNRELHFNISGELVEAIPVKDNRSFYYSNIPH